MKRKAATGCLILSILTACAHERFTYLPEGRLDESKQDIKEVTYPIFPGPPEGGVTIKFVGISDIRLKDGESPTRTLHLEMRLKNDSKGEWTLDVPDVYLSFPAYGRKRAAYIVGPHPGVPRVALKPGEGQSLQFYFALPAPMKTEDELTGFTFDWSVHTPERDIVQQTRFERVPIAPPVSPQSAYPVYPCDYCYGPGWGAGPNWWYGPSWAPWPPGPAVVPGPPGQPPIPLVPRGRP